MHTIEFIQLNSWDQKTYNRK